MLVRRWWRQGEAAESLAVGSVSLGGAGEDAGSPAGIHNTRIAVSQVAEVAHRPAGALCEAQLPIFCFHAGDAPPRLWGTLWPAQQLNAPWIYPRTRQNALRKHQGHLSARHAFSARFEPPGSVCRHRGIAYHHLVRDFTCAGIQRAQGKLPPVPPRRRPSPPLFCRRRLGGGLPHHPLLSTAGPPISSTTMSSEPTPRSSGKKRVRFSETPPAVREYAVEEEQEAAAGKAAPAGKRRTLDPMEALEGGVG